MNKRDKIFLGILLFLPIISSILSTIHIIALTKLGNPFGMAIAVAVTFEIGSLVSFLLSGGTILKRDTSKAWLYFIFILLFLLQALGNVYSGFNYMTKQLVIDPTYLDTFKEMCFNIFNVTETKWILAASIGLPLPIISLIMLKFALDKSTIDETIDSVSDDSNMKEIDVKEDKKDEIVEIAKETIEDIAVKEDKKDETVEITKEIEKQQDNDDDLSIITKEDEEDKMSIKEHKQPQGFDPLKKNFE